LSYCPPAVVVTGLHPVTRSGEVRVTPEKLRELMGGVALEASGFTTVHLLLVDTSGRSSSSSMSPDAAISHSVRLDITYLPTTAASSAAVRDLGLMRPTPEGAVCAQVWQVYSLGGSATAPTAAAGGGGNDLFLPDAGSAKFNVFSSLGKAAALMTTLLDQPGVMTPPAPEGTPGPSPSISSLWQSHWQGPISNWWRYGGREKREASRQLGSTEWNFFMAARAPQDFKEFVLPLLSCKLTSELTFIDQMLLLQAHHNQPLLPHPQQVAAADDGGGCGAGS